MLDDALAVTLELLLAVRVRQFQQANGILRRKVHLVCVQVLQKCFVHCVRKASHVQNTALDNMKLLYETSYTLNCVAIRGCMQKHS